MSFRDRVSSQIQRRMRRHRPRPVEALEPRIVLDSTVVINEIMYNPSGDDTGLEWIELYNQLNVDMDISEWVIDGAVNYEFPDKTIVPGRGHLVVAADPETLATNDGFSSAYGPWEGRLSNGGEEILLYNNDNRLMNSVDYGDNGDWPTAPDGGGVSLAKHDQFSGSHVSSNWSFSQRVGGTPGVDNIILPGTFLYEDILSEEAPAKAFVPSDASLGLSWIEPGFDDSNWLSGTTGVGHESSSTGNYDRYLGLDLDAPGRRSGSDADRRCERIGLYPSAFHSRRGSSRTIRLSCKCVTMMDSLRILTA